MAEHTIAVESNIPLPEAMGKVKRRKGEKKTWAEIVREVKQNSIVSLSEIVPTQTE